MHTSLLTMGFIKLPDGSYINHEFQIKVYVVDEEYIKVKTDKGLVKATLKELETAMVNGGFGEV